MSTTIVDDDLVCVRVIGMIVVDVYAIVNDITFHPCSLGPIDDYRLRKTRNVIGYATKNI